MNELEKLHKAVWDVIRANAEAIAESSGDEWGDLCAVAADLADDCDPNLARGAIVEAVAAVNALPELLAKVKRLEEALEKIADPATYSHSLLSCCQHTFDDTCELFSDIARAALNQETKP